MTGDWTPQRVLDAAAAWVWVPPDAVDHDLGVYRLTYYPDRTSVHWSRSERPATELVDEVLAKVRADGRTSLRWRVNDATRPADTERHLLVGGFVLVETVEVLAWELGDAATPRLPRLDVPRDVTVRPVTDEAGGRRGVRGLPRAGCVPGAARRQDAAGARARRDTRAGQGPGRHQRADPAPRRVHRLWQGALLPAHRAERAPFVKRTARPDDGP